MTLEIPGHKKYVDNRKDLFEKVNIGQDVSEKMVGVVRLLNDPVGLKERAEGVMVKGVDPGKVTRSFH